MGKLKWVIVAGVVLIAALILLSTKQNVPPTTNPAIGYYAPDFTLKTMDGKTVKLSDFRGKPVYVNFWASWCPPCKEEMPDLEKFYEQNKNNVVVLGVNITFNDKIPDVQNLLNADHITYPILLDQDGNNGAAVSYQVSGIPASFFIDKNGIIRDMQVGAMTYSQMEASIQKAMN